MLCRGMGHGIHTVYSFVYFETCGLSCATCGSAKKSVCCVNPCSMKCVKCRVTCMICMRHMRQGQEALRSRLRRLNLPAEDWAEEVRDVYAQLVETLEQLQAREMELDEHEELIAR